MQVTFDLWLLLTGAASGAAAVLVSRGKGRLFAGAAIGAAVAVAMGFLRTFL